MAKKELGNLDAGNQKIPFDGKDEEGKKLPDGIYTFSVTAKDMNDEEVPIKLTSKTKIRGIDIHDDEGALYSDAGKIKFTDVESVGTSGFNSLLSAEKVANSNQAAPLNPEQLKKPTAALGQQAPAGPGKKPIPGAPGQPTAQAPNKGAPPPGSSQQAMEIPPEILKQAQAANLKKFQQASQKQAPRGGAPAPTGNAAPAKATVQKNNPNQGQPKIK